MAGKRQHYLPRFLLKGFNSRNQSKKMMSWVFTKDKVYEANILNIGLQQYFYGDINTDLDSKITDLESRFSKQINEIRNFNFSANNKNVEEISKLVYFQLIRTKNIRLTLANVYHYGINLANKRIKEDFSEKAFFKIKSMFRNTEQYKKFCTLIPQKKLECMLDIHIKAINESGMIDSYFREGLKQTEEITNQAHNQMIEGHINGENKGIYKKLLNLHWNRVEFNDNSLVLGDCGCYIKNSDGIATTWINTKNIEHVLFPISSKYLIIGSNKHLQVSPDLEEVNIGSCQCSKEFFISSTNTKREKDYLKSINQDRLSKIP
jgi:hypothetical protein